MSTADFDFDGATGELVLHPEPQQNGWDTIPADLRRAGHDDDNANHVYPSDPYQRGGPRGGTSPTTPNNNNNGPLPKPEVPTYATIDDVGLEMAAMAGGGSPVSSLGEEDFGHKVELMAQGRQAETIQLYKEKNSSLGFSVVGLRSEHRGELGIFVQEIQPGGISARWVHS